MSVAATILLAAAAWPLWTAWQATAHTTLRPALAWASAGWAAWLLALATRSDLAAYVALGLSGCAGVAVLGARRPGVGAWNFVVAGLLAVVLLPLAEGALVGTPVQLGTFRNAFLAGLVGTTVVNYLPTRLGGAAGLNGV